MPDGTSLCAKSTVAGPLLSCLVYLLNPVYKPESTNSLARWMKSILSNAGIDTSVFQAHNVRCASVTNANKGVFQ